MVVVFVYTFQKRNLKSQQKRIILAKRIIIIIMSIEKRIVQKFKSGEYKDVGFIEIAKREGLVTDDELKLLRAKLNGLCKDNVLYQSKGKFNLSKREIFKDPKKAAEAEIVRGEIRTNPRGFAFLVTDSGDYFIAGENLGYALNGDICECAVLYGKSGKRDAAIVLKVLDHTITKLAGVYFNEGAFSYLRPDDTHYLCDILLTDLGGFKVEKGDKIFVEITSFKARRCPEGKIIAHLGKSFELKAEEDSIIYSCGFYEGFSSLAASDARHIDQKVADNRLIDRVNLENELVFTIDGDTAKDFDDAVSLSILENGNYYLGVHIADVSEYVTHESALDKSAFMRGTSAYFPDRVIPMLPFELSNGICSLVENERRLTLSVFAEIDKAGKIVDSKLCESYIKSKKRMTYANVQKIIDGDEWAQKEFEQIVPTVLMMNELKNVLENRRLQDGYIDLAVKEGDVILSGDKITVELHKSTDATRLIEQFMILANEVVAEHLFYLSLPAVYRVHEKPDKSKTESFKEFLKAIGENVQWRKDELYPLDYQRLLKSLQGTPKFAVVNKAMLRSMQKAYYSTQNLGHFGLASKCYCHFTSPIRRYPDLLCHRALKASLKGDIGALIDVYADFFSKAAAQSSKRERLADEAERAVTDLYKVKYLEDFIGEEFSGVISGVNQHGLYVELENTCEGFIPIELLPGGALEYDEKSFALRSKKRVYRMGDTIRIAVVGCDIGQRKCFFAPANLTRGLPKGKKCGRV